MNGAKNANAGIGRAASQVHRLLTEAWRLQPLYVSLYAILLSFVVGGVLISIIGVNPFTAYWALLRGMVGGGDQIAGSVARSVPFIGSALALAFAFRAGLFNIGAEGQLLAGGITAAYVGALSWMSDLPGIVAIPLILIAGTLGGAFWGGIPGVLRTKTGAHEVISTIMLNSLVLFGVRWMVNSRDPIVLRDTESTVPRTDPISDTAVLPELVDSQPVLHTGLLALLGICFVVAFVLNRTTFGFEVGTVGLNPHASHYAGINVNRVIVISMAASGSVCRAGGSFRDLGHQRLLPAGHVLPNGLRRHRHRLVGPHQPGGHHRRRPVVGVDAVGSAADAAGSRCVHRRGADHPGHGAVVRGR